MGYDKRYFYLVMEAVFIILRQKIFFLLYYSLSVLFYILDIDLNRLVNVSWVNFTFIEIGFRIVCFFIMKWNVKTMRVTF